MEYLKTFENGLILATNGKDFCLTDEWLTDWIIFYGESKKGFNLGWAHDGVFDLTGIQARDIRLHLDKMSVGLIREKKRVA